MADISEILHHVFPNFISIAKCIFMQITLLIAQYFYFY